MRTITSLFLVVSGLFCFSQEEQGNYALAASNFMTLYNDADYNGLFNTFNADMQKALPRERTLAFFSQNVNAIMGGIKEMNFDRIENGAHIYRANFDRAVAEIMISLTAQHRINGFTIKPVNNEALPILERNRTKMALPFGEEWSVFWGGLTEAQNYHIAYPNQQYAYDLLIEQAGATYEGDTGRNESYYVFGKDVIAPCDAKVAQVIEGVPDNVPGVLNPEQLTGNTIVLETENSEFVLFAHLKEGSIAVQEGQTVNRGDLLGQCGNSGNSTEPHLHISLQNDVAMLRSQGAKLYFDQLWVNGVRKSDYLPVKGDHIKNID